MRKRRKAERVFKERTVRQLAFKEARAREDDEEPNDDDRSNRTLRARTKHHDHGSLSTGVGRQNTYRRRFRPTALSSFAIDTSETSTEPTVLLGRADMS